MRQITREPSPQEIEILKLLAQGKSTQQIADELFVSKVTIRNHYANLNKVLETNSKIQAVLKALSLGIVTLS